jgi:hypothetical protein
MQAPIHQQRIEIHLAGRGAQGSGFRGQGKIRKWKTFTVFLLFPEL